MIHQNGEEDLRYVYAALVVAKLTNILDDDLTENCFEYIKKCQRYEGRFGQKPFVEAHGGYTFCATAALSILGRLEDIDN